MGLFYLRALKSLGHEVTVWDPRTTSEPPKLQDKPDLTVVIKEFVNPATLPKPRFYIFPDQTTHENYASYLDSVTPSYDRVFFCMKHSKEVMERYGARLLPFAIDKQIHRPVAEIKENIDVSFVGTNRLGRMELVNFLNNQGVKVQIWGNNWPKETPNYMGEAIYLGDKRHVYSSTKIALNHHYLIGPNMRFFEALGYGCFLLSDMVDGIEGLGFKDGVHYVSYRDKLDLTEKINYYLQHSEERQKIARQGRTFVKKHTYQQRVKEVLESI